MARPPTLTGKKKEDKYRALRLPPEMCSHGDDVFKSTKQHFLTSVGNKIPSDGLVSVQVSRKSQSDGLVTYACVADVHGQWVVLTSVIYLSTVGRKS